MKVSVQNMFQWLSALGGIILVDLVLSGDNALVIGAMAAGLPREQRWMAILAGGAGAVILRISFAILATFLLQIPFVQAIGGAILLCIAIRLLMSRNEKQPSSLSTKTKQVKKSFLLALVAILVADATMSLDNVLAVGAMAHGNVSILVVGLLLSVTLLLVGSAVISELINRLPWLLDVASLVLAWTAAAMILSDLRFGPWLDHLPWSDFIVPALTLGTILIANVVLRLQGRGLAFTKR
jgi:YjbE family integral membrane protein